MIGPELLVANLYPGGTTDKFGNDWEYHSRSDRHSKVACWGVLVDLLNHSDLLRSHAERPSLPT